MRSLRLFGVVLCLVCNLAAQAQIDPATPLERVPHQNPGRGIEKRPPNVDPTRDAVPLPRKGTARLPIEALPEHLRRGRHTLTLNVALDRPFRSIRTENCNASVDPYPADYVGFGQDEDPNPLVIWPACAALILQRAITFDTRLLNEVQNKIIERAVLSYEEVEPEDCGSLFRQQRREGSKPCWTNGAGQSEHKPQGCVDVRVPEGDWRAVTDGNLRLTAEPDTSDVRRLTSHEWDVTTSFKFEQPGGLPLGGVRRYGFLLSGWPRDLSVLSADDNTMCLSAVRNIQLRVTYNVVGPDGPSTK